MDNHSDWQKSHTKSILVDTSITVIGTNDDGDIPIQLDVKAIELDYGPVIDFEVSSSAKFTNMIDWSDHPFMCSNEYMEDNTVSNIVDDTPAIRALIEELVSPVKRKLYTSTDCTYKARLIKAILTFWT
jgi:hypothetical protein